MNYRLTFHLRNKDVFFAELKTEREPARVMTSLIQEKWQAVGGCKLVNMDDVTYVDFAPLDK